MGNLQLTRWVGGFDQLQGFLGPNNYNKWFLNGSNVQAYYHDYLHVLGVVGKSNKNIF